MKNLCSWCIGIFVYPVLRLQISMCISFPQPWPTNRQTHTQRETNIVLLLIQINLIYILFYAHYFQTPIISLKKSTRLERSCRPPPKDFRCNLNKNQNLTSKILLKIQWKRLERIISAVLRPSNSSPLLLNPHIPPPLPR